MALDIIESVSAIIFPFNQTHYYIYVSFSIYLSIPLSFFFFFYLALAFFYYYYFYFDLLIFHYIVRLLLFFTF